MAYELLNLSPQGFAALTPGEFLKMARGARQRREDDQELAAWVTTHLMNVHLKTPIRMERLLGRPLRHKRDEQLRARKAKDN